MTVVVGPVTIPDSEEWRMESVAGEPYRIFVARPSGAPPPGGYPTIYLLDANATFGTVAEAVRLRARRPDVTGVVPCVVVGIAYPTAEPYDRRRRMFDLTWGPPADQELAARAGDASAPTGGASAFLAWIENELMPRIGAIFPVDPARTALVGHSMAGYFAVRTLLDSPGIFGAHVAASPSLWWDREALFARAGELASRLEARGHSARLLLTVGEYEQRLSPGEIGRAGAAAVAERREARAMVANAQALVRRLAEPGHPRLTVAFEEFAAEDHASAMLRTVNVLLRFVLAGGESG